MISNDLFASAMIYACTVKLKHFGFALSTGCYLLRFSSCRRIASNVTDYRYHAKTSFCLTRIPSRFLTSYVLLLVDHRRHPLATYLMYLFHLISIDLESSRSFNTHTAKLTSKHNQMDTTTFAQGHTSCLHYSLLMSSCPA